MIARRSIPSMILGALLIGGAELAAAQQAVPRPNPEAIWRSACSYCHDTGVAHRLLGTHPPVATVTQIVRSGIGAMPAFHPSEIGPAQLRELARWVNEHSAPPQPSAKSP